MKALVCEQPGSFQYIKKEKPLLETGRAILKIKRVGICGTDLHAFEGTQPFFSYPRILGHELAGEIVEVETNNGFAVGLIAILSKSARHSSGLVTTIGLHLYASHPP